VTDTNVFQLSQPGTFADRLTEVLRDGARAARLLHCIKRWVSQSALAAHRTGGLLSELAVCSVQDQQK
jgi:hypothetical protein